MEFIYSLFENYGIWVLLVVTFLAQLGLPLGSTFFLMWYGSTLDSYSSLYIVIPATACAAILGDMTAFLLGKQFSRQLDNAENRYTWIAKRISQTRGLIDSYGILIVWISRFLVTGLGPVVNYLLGSRNYPTFTFLKWVVFGEIIFATEMIYFGYHFKDTWEDLLAIIADAGWLIALVFVLLWIIKKLIKRGGAILPTKFYPKPNKTSTKHVGLRALAQPTILSFCAFIRLAPHPKGLSSLPRQHCLALLGSWIPQSF